MRDSNIPIKLTQPNGSALECFASGDEFFNYLHDKDGNLIKRNEKTGYYTYVDFVGGAIVATNNIVALEGAFKGNESNVKKLTIMDIPSEYIKSVYEKRLSEEQAANRPGESRSNQAEGVNNGYRGTLQNLTIFIQFSDTPDQFPNAARQSFYAQLFNTGAESLSKYFDEVSYGITKVNTVFCTTKAGAVFSYKDSHDRAYYAHCEKSQETEREQLLVYNALNAVKDNISKDLNLDINGDGFVDCVSFIVCGGVEGWGSILWPHKWSLFRHEVSINNKKVKSYALQIDERNSNNGIGVLAHETLHIVGFQDLYRYTTIKEYKLDPVGSWDIMSSSKGQHPNAYTKETVANWMSARKVTESGWFTLNPLTSSTNNSLFLDSPYDRDESIFVEYRRKTGNFEKALIDSSLLIYRTNDKLLGNGNSKAECPPNKNGIPDEIFLYQDKDGPDKSIYKSGYKTYFGDNSNPASVSCNGTKMGIYITEIGTAGETIRFYLGVWFCDSKLEKIIREKIGKATGTLHIRDLAQITSLEIRGNNEEWRLDGIESLIKLTSIDLSYMTIRGGIRCLSELPELKSQTISHCKIIGN